jgi:hypothetical protein
LKLDLSQPDIHADDHIARNFLSLRYPGDWFSYQPHGLMVKSKFYAVLAPPAYQPHAAFAMRAFCAVLVGFQLLSISHGLSPIDQAKLS